jgi:hypothetical protein
MKRAFHTSMGIPTQIQYILWHKLIQKHHSIISNRRG